MCAGLLRVSNVMSEFEIEIVSKLGVSVIGAANDAENALNVMDEAMSSIRLTIFKFGAGR